MWNFAGAMNGSVLAVAALSVGCAPASAGSAAASPVASASAAPATGPVAVAGAGAQHRPDGAGGATAAGTSGAPGTERATAGTVGASAAAPQPVHAIGPSGSVPLPPGCLPYGQDVILRGVVERPLPSAKAPNKKGKSGSASNTAWRFQLDSPQCVGAPSAASEPVRVPVSMMTLVPILGVANSYKKLEGQRVEATGVLVGVVSGTDVHVVYMVRAFTPVPGSP